MRKRKHHADTLSRDRHIFGLAKQGYHTKEIARLLHITVYVVYDARRRRRGMK